jgi:hypothetical protein
MRPSPMPSATSSHRPQCAVRSAQKTLEARVAATLGDRWAAGAHGMRTALQRLRSPEAAWALAPGLLLHELECRTMAS